MSHGLVLDDRPVEGGGPGAAAHRRIVRLRDGDLRVPQPAAVARIPQGGWCHDTSRRIQSQQNLTEDQESAQTAILVTPPLAHCTLSYTLPLCPVTVTHPHTLHYVNLDTLLTTIIIICFYFCVMDDRVISYR